MKIKKLTIHGFKSFVDKVHFNFSMGTSAIIGPNGCGKSNIVDSIRWVLGEQNARHLRGKHMEDIIFNGSDARKQLGMAEVVLTFSTEGGLAPARYASFPEIEISRRLYRSGESEYYINKVQARLKDIVELFTDTGIGTRAYSIIEQGQVGWLINAKPEERRIIFEEAAGINKFKHKKEAALKRLEATKENLTRVNDIISEVKRQLNSLNRQAKKAERYKALRDELQAIELRLSSLEYVRLKSTLDDSSKRLEGIKDEEIALTTAITEIEVSSEDIKAEYANEEGEFKSVRERAFAVEREIQAEERASELARVRVEEIKRGEERISLEIEELKKRKESVASEIERLRSSIGENGANIESETKMLAELSGRLDSLVSKLREKENIQRGEKSESFKITTRLSDIRHAIQTQLRDEEHLRVRETKAATEREEVIKTLSSKEEPLKAINEKIAEAAARKTSIEAEIREIRAKAETLEKERVAKGVELKALKDRLSKEAARLSTLEDMEKNYENLKGGAKAIMLKGEKNGIRGLLADVIETNPGFERAVESLLGERLQYVIVESHKEGVEAIEYLKKNSAGRGSFVPVKDLRANPVPVQAGTCNYPGVKELLSEVRIKEGYDSIVNYLLGDTLIADNLESALSAWKEEGVSKTIVTLEGEIIDAQGIITGGALTSDLGILQRRGEIKRLKGSKSELERANAGLEEGLRQAEDEIKRTKTLSEEYREKLHRIDIESVNFGSELKRLTEEVGRLTRTRDSLAAEIAEAGRRLADIANKKASLSAERDGLEKGMAEREKRIALLSDEISVIAEEKEKLSASVTEIKIRLAQARERFESLKRELNEKERAIEDTNRRIEAKSIEIERGKSEAAERQRQVEALKEKLQGLLGRMDAIKKEETSRSETLAALSDRIKAVDAELRQLKSRYSELQELRGELTIEIKELELSLSHLKDRVQEKYGNDIALYRPAEGESAPDLNLLEEQKEDLREKISSLGEVSLSALAEYAELENRHNFLLDQQTDLNSSVDALHTAITRINRTTREKFKTAFEEINAKFQETFPKFFNGGKAELRLTEEGDVLEAGVEIVAQPPGKRLQNITLLSGGEKALTATSLIFAIFLIKPSPFCLLDEVDAPLDDANIDRFNLFVKEMSQLSQFLLITHNKKTMEMADTLFGITMEEPGVSKIISVKF